MPESYDPIDEALAVVGKRRGGLPDASGATSDRHLVELWLRSKRSENTRMAYARDVRLFLGFLDALPSVGSSALPERPKTLSRVTVAHVQAFAEDVLGREAPRTAARRLSAVKSLLSFAQKTGYLPFNVGSVVMLPSYPSQLAQRILSEEQVSACIAAAAQPRDKALLRFLYLTGARASEAAQVQWDDLQKRTDRLVVTIQGKGGKERVLAAPLSLLADVEPLRKSSMSGHVFETCGGRPMSRSDVWRVVRRAALCAGFSASPHCLRHSHASHAIRHGAPVHVVQQTLGHASVQTTGHYLHMEQGDSSALYLSSDH